MDQNVAGNSGWWMCSLYGRHGLAPANRLQLLPLNGITATSSRHVTEKNNLIDIKTDESSQNIYQIPSVPRPSSSQTYERMDMIYKIPSSPLSASKSPVPSAMKHSTGPEVNMVLNTLSFQGCLHLCKEKTKTHNLHLVDVSLFLGKCSLMSRSRVLQKCIALKPLLPKVLTDGPMLGTGMQHHSLYEPVKANTHRLQTFFLNANSSPSCQGPHTDRIVCMGTSAADSMVKCSTCSPFPLLLQG